MSELITWDDYRDASNFANHPKQMQDDLRTRMLNPEATASYSFVRTAQLIMPHLNDTDAKQLLSNYVNSKDKNYNYHRYSNIYPMLKNVGDRDSHFIKTLLSETKDKKIKKALLALSGLTLEEEIEGLRGLATSSSCPDIIYHAKYRPSLSALKKLPSVMRLKVLETLLGNEHLSYNVFENITNEDEFKLLLFSSTLRHRDRVEEVWNAYKITKSIGLRAKVTVTADCENCGSYTVDVTSARTSAPGMLKKTYIGRLLTKTRCALCGRYIKNKPNIKGGIAGAA